MIRRHPHWLTHNGLALVAILSLILTACQSPRPTATPDTLRKAFERSATPTLPATRTPTRTATATSTLSPTPTPTATDTPTPALTPLAPLTAPGPYLLYQAVLHGQPALAELNAAGTQGRTIALPPGASFVDLKDAVSPDGHWLAFYTGSAGSTDAPASQPPAYDLALNIFNLQSEKIARTIPLLPTGYPDSLARIPTVMVTRTPDLKPDAGAIRALFLTSIRQVAWSSDGHYLAFTAAIKGPGVGAYLYNLDNGVITQLPSGPDQVTSLRWSPDNLHLLLGSAYQNCSSNCTNYHIIEVETGKNWDLFYLRAAPVPLLSIGWNDKSSIRYAYSTHDTGAVDLSTVDIQTGKRTFVYRGPFRSFTLDPDSKLLAIYLPKDAANPNQTDPGVYIYSPDDLKKQIAFPLDADDPTLELHFIGLGGTWFVAAGTSGLWSIPYQSPAQALRSGTILKSEVSPYRQHIALYDSDQKMLFVTDLRGEVVAQIPSAGGIPAWTWSPTSDSLFVATGGRLFALPLETGRPHLSDSALPDLPQGLNATWIW